jgi:hypothetical protein
MDKVLVLKKPSEEGKNTPPINSKGHIRILKSARKSNILRNTGDCFSFW